MPKFSIVTISFNQGEFLEKAIQSVLGQRNVDLEYILIDAGSEDHSHQIIEKYRREIHKTVLERDRGPAHGLNKGFALASGQLLGYLNADDVLLPGALAEASAALELAGADVVYGNGYFIDSTGRCTGSCLSTPFNLRHLLFGGMVVMQQSTFFRAKAFHAVGGFNEQNRTCWDGELFFEFARQGLTISHVDAYWSVFRIHSGGISGSGRLQVQYRADRARIYGPSIGKYGRWLPWIQTLTRWESRILAPSRSLRLLAERLSGPPAIAI